MVAKAENPAALAGAGRAEVTMLVGKNDFLTDTPVHLDRQVRQLLSLYRVSRAVAVVVAELAFSKGGEA